MLISRVLEVPLCRIIGHESIVLSPARGQAGAMDWFKGFLGNEGFGEWEVEKGVKEVIGVMG